MIKFKSIRWKNLLSTGNEFTEIQLDKAQTTLIVGENGAGKSTFLEALTYSLFGKPFRKINKPQLVNSMTRKNMVVEVEFSVGSNSYKIVRGIRPNVFEIYMNGAMMDQSSDNKDYQEILEKQILKVNYKSFCQVVVLGSASYVPFMQLPTGQRREIIEDLLDLQVFTVMNNLLKDRLYFNAEDVRSADSEKKLLIEKIKLVKKHSAEREEDDRRVIEDREQAIASTNTQIDQAKIAIVNGGLLGRGPGNSEQRNFLPHPYSDFIFANGWSSSKQKFDTISIMYAGFAYQNAKNEDKAIALHSRLIKEEVNTKEAIDAYIAACQAVKTKYPKPE